MTTTTLTVREKQIITESLDLYYMKYLDGNHETKATLTEIFFQLEKTLLPSKGIIVVNE